MKPDSPADSPDASTPTSPQAPAQRPRLNLAKRTVSEAPKEDNAAASSKASPFGAARPIDTSAREQEIEEKRKIAIREKKEADDKAREEKRAKEAATKAENADKSEKEENTEGENKDNKQFEILRREDEADDLGADLAPLVLLGVDVRVRGARPDRIDQLVELARGNSLRRRSDHVAGPDRPRDRRRKTVATSDDDLGLCSDSAHDEEHRHRSRPARRRRALR